MELSRNDLCPCGSGNKYKKCCQAQVEEFTAGILQAMGTGVSAEGLNIARELGLWCGLQLQDAGPPPAPALLGRLLTEAWGTGDPAEILSGRFKELLRGKEHLLKLRIPVDLLTGATLQMGAALQPGAALQDGAGLQAGVAFQAGAAIQREAPFRTEAGASQSGATAGAPGRSDQGDRLEWIMEKLPPGFYDYASFQMALSLRNDIYTGGELKTLLTGFSWAVLDLRARTGLVACILDATLTDLAEAQRELSQLDTSGPDDAGSNERLRRFFADHPAYDGFISTRMIAAVEPAYRAITGPGGLQAPFYAIAGGCYALCLEALNALEGLEGPDGLNEPDGRQGRQEKREAALSDEKVRQVLREVLWGQEEHVLFIPLLREAVAGWPEAGRTEDLSRSLRELGELLSGLFMSAQFAVVENFYVSCVIGTVQDLPPGLPGVADPVGGLLDLCDHRVIEQYVRYLEERRQADEAAHVRRQFQSWAGRITEKYAGLPPQLRG